MNVISYTELRLLEAIITEAVWFEGQFGPPIYTEYLQKNWNASQNLTSEQRHQSFTWIPRISYSVNSVLPFGILSRLYTNVLDSF